MLLWWIDDNGRNTLKGEPAFVASDGTALRNSIEAQNYAVATGQSVSTWLDDEGSPGNPANPIILDDWLILECVYTIPVAREDLYTMLPSLLPAEQTRLNRLLERAPLALTEYVDPQTQLDRLSRKLNAGIRTVGPYGGQWYGYEWIWKI